jgi:hypothetical protein
MVAPWEPEFSPGGVHRVGPVFRAGEVGALTAIIRNSFVGAHEAACLQCASKTPPKSSATSTHCCKRADPTHPSAQSAHRPMTSAPPDRLYRHE